MTYIIGYLTVPIVITFFVVVFAIRPAYERKHGKPMGPVKSFLCFLLISFGILFLSLIGKMA